MDAGDAALFTQLAVSLLREHLPRSVVVNGIISSAGQRAVVVPEKAVAEYVVWAASTAELAEAVAKVRRCFQAGALAAGARCDVVADRDPGAGRPYAAMRHDLELAHHYETNARALGRSFLDVQPVLERFAMCTDMGNVSQVVPAIHPFIRVGGDSVNHDRAFAAACITPTADHALLDGAVAMAWTLINAATTSTVREGLLGTVPLPEV